MFLLIFISWSLSSAIIEKRVGIPSLLGDNSFPNRHCVLVSSLKAIEFHHLSIKHLHWNAQLSNIALPSCQSQWQVITWFYRPLNKSSFFSSISHSSEGGQFEGKEPHDLQQNLWKENAQILEKRLPPQSQNEQSLGTEKTTFKVLPD